MEHNPATELTEDRAVRSLTAIAQPHRLRVFRALVVAGESGLTPGALAELLNVAPSSLSFHLKELTYSGLASVQARGRNLIYRANFAQMNGLLAYLTQHCCQGAACAVVTGCVAC